MLSVRLNDDLENQLSYVSMNTGLSKNIIISNALTEYLRNANLSEVPLKEKVIENGFELFKYRQNERVEQYKDAHEIADWIKRNAIFTKIDNDETRYGKITPGIYGRNIVIGFTDSFDDHLYVISRHISNPYKNGTSSYHLYLTTFESWKKYMVEVKVDS